MDKKINKQQDLSLILESQEFIKKLQEFDFPQLFFYQSKYRKEYYNLQNKLKDFTTNNTYLKLNTPLWKKIINLFSKKEIYQEFYEIQILKRDIYYNILNDFNNFEDILNQKKQEYYITHNQYYQSLTYQNEKLYNDYQRNQSFLNKLINLSQVHQHKNIPEDKIKILHQEWNKLYVILSINEDYMEIFQWLDVDQELNNKNYNNIFSAIYEVNQKINKKINNTQWDLENQEKIAYKEMLQTNKKYYNGIQ